VAPPIRLQEHRRIFNYATGKSTYFGKGKVPAKKKTCTLKFFCLGSPNDEQSPGGAGQKTPLSNVGLGPAQVIFEVDSPKIQQELMGTYPLLSSGGGYELLLYQRGGSEQGFHKMGLPHTVSRLKSLANQSTIYIRPLQVDILEEAHNSAQENSQQQVRLSNKMTKINTLFHRLNFCVTLRWLHVLARAHLYMTVLMRIYKELE